MDKIDRDHFDARKDIPKVAEKAISKTATFAAPLAIGLAGKATILETLGTGAFATLAAGASAKDLISAGIELLPQGQLTDKRIGYHAQPFVFRGTDKLRVKDSDLFWERKSLEAGDNFYWLNLPQLKIDNPGETLNAQRGLVAVRDDIWTDVAITSLRGFMDQAADKDWKALAIPGFESMPKSVRDKLPPSTLVKMAELFDNKGIKPQKLGEKKVTVVTREDLENFFLPKPVQITVPEEVISYEDIKVPVIEQEFRPSKLLEALGNEDIITLVTEAKLIQDDPNDPYAEGKLLDITGQINRRVDRIILQSLESNGPPTIAEYPKIRTEKQRPTRVMYIKNGESGKYLQMFMGRIGHPPKPIDRKMMGILEGQKWDQLEDTLKSPGQLAYFVYETLRDKGIDGLLDPYNIEKEVTRKARVVNIEDVERTILRALDVKEVDAIVAEAIGWEMSLKRQKEGPPGPAFFNWRTFLHEAKSIKPKLRNLAGAAILLAAAPLLGNFLTPRPAEEGYSDQVDASQKPPGVIVDISRALQKLAGERPGPVNIQPTPLPSGELGTPSPSPVTGSSEKPQATPTPTPSSEPGIASKIAEAGKEIANQILPFEPSLPSDAILWKIQEVEGMSSSGYYTLSTSSTYNNGEWELNKSQAKKLNLPEKVSGPQLIMTQSEFINPVTGYTFKVPIKHGTRVGSMYIVDFDGNKLKPEVSELSDGTVEVVIPPSFSGIGSLKVQIQTSLVPSEQYIHATKAVDPIDLSKLSERARETLNKGLAANDKFSEALVQAIGTSHKYSLKPKNYDLMKPIQSAEERANVEAEWTECWCYTCNELNTLLSSHHPGGVPVNLALGYLHGVDSPASEPAGKSAFIRQDTAHAWGVDGFGRILDATPGEISDDELTRKYIEQLQRNPPPPKPTPTPPTPNAAIATAQTYISELFPTSTPTLVPPARTPAPSPSASTAVPELGTSGTPGVDSLPSATPIPPTETPIPPTATETPNSTTLPSPETSPTRPQVTLQATAVASPGPSPEAEKIEQQKPWLDNVPGWAKAAAAAAVVTGVLGGAWGARRWLKSQKPPEAPQPQAAPPPEPEPEPIVFPPSSYTNLENGDAIVFIEGAERRISKEDIILGKEFLTWVSFGAAIDLDLSNINTEQLESRYAKEPGQGKPQLTLTNLRFNTKPEFLRRYLNHPSLFEESAHLNQEQALHMRQLAKILIDLKGLPVKISEV